MKSKIDPQNPASAKPVLAIDIDEVLSPLIYKYGPWLAERTNKKITFERGMSYYLDRQAGLSALEVEQALNDYFNSEHYSESLPLDGAIDAIGTLQSKYSLVLVTGRSTLFRDATHRWLDEHFSAVFKAVHFVGQFNEGDNPATSKLELIEQLDAIGLIDDMLSTVAYIAAHGRRGILFGDYEWNHAEELPAGVTRVKGWKEVKELLVP